MSADRFNRCLGNICGKFLGDSFEDIITDAYPRLKSDSELRNRYAEYLESLDVVDSYNSICALSKIAYATKNATGQIPEIQRDPEQVLERLLPTVKIMANTMSEIMEQPDNPLTGNIMEDSKGYLFALTLYTNDSNPRRNTRNTEDEAREVARQVASCVIGKNLTEFIEIIEENADISAKSMLLIGNLHPKFQQLAAVKNPEISDFCQLAATFPRSTFAACVALKAENKQIEDYNSFLEKVASEDTVKTAKSLDKERIDTMFRSFDIAEPAPAPKQQDAPTPKITNERE